MISDAIDKLADAREALERLDRLEECEARFALVHAVKVLRYCKDADGLSPTRRKEAQSVYRMCAAAAGMDHE